MGQGQGKGGRIKTGEPKIFITVRGDAKKCTKNNRTKAADWDLAKECHPIEIEIVALQKQVRRIQWDLRKVIYVPLKIEGGVN